MDKQREEFEAWAKSKHLDTNHKEKDAWGHEEYSPHIESIWMRWQAAQAAQPAQPVGINGLTEAETSASMSVVGLSKPKVAQPAQTELRHRIRVHLANRNYYSHSEFCTTLEELMAEQEAQPAQMPDGYVLVPVEPTGAMCRALFRNLIHADNEAYVIKAVLAAAPSTKEGS